MLVLFSDWILRVVETWRICQKAPFVPLSVYDGKHRATRFIVTSKTVKGGQIKSLAGPEVKSIWSGYLPREKEESPPALKY